MIAAAAPRFCCLLAVFCFSVLAFTQPAPKPTVIVSSVEEQFEVEKAAQGDERALNSYLTSHKYIIKESPLGTLIAFSPKLPEIRRFADLNEVLTSMMRAIPVSGVADWNSLSEEARELFSDTVGWRLNSGEGEMQGAAYALMPMHQFSFAHAGREITIPIALQSKEWTDAVHQKLIENPLKPGSRDQRDSDNNQTNSPKPDKRGIVLHYRAIKTADRSNAALEAIQLLTEECRKLTAESQNLTTAYINRIADADSALNPSLKKAKFDELPEGVQKAVSAWLQEGYRVLGFDSADEALLSLQNAGPISISRQLAVAVCSQPGQIRQPGVQSGEGVRPEFLLDVIFSF